MIKKVLITGSSSGIGKAVTEYLLAQGVTVIGVARDHQKIGFSHANYIPFYVDCARLELLEVQFKEISRMYPDLDAMIGCCGYGYFAELEQFSWSQMQEMMNVNFLSQALLVKTLIANFKRRTHTKIIFIGTECALAGQRKGSLYCASKFALRGFIQSLRHECRQADVAISLINPGLVDTPFFNDLNFAPGEQAIAPQQIAEMVGLILRLANNCVVEEINCQPMRKTIIKKNLAPN